MMYAGSKNRLVQAAELTKVITSKCNLQYILAKVVSKTLFFIYLDYTIIVIMLCLFLLNRCLRHETLMT